MPPGARTLPVARTPPVPLDSISRMPDAIRCRATDPGGLSASVGFRIVVENPASLATASAPAPEGGVARLTASFAASASTNRRGTSM